MKQNPTYNSPQYDIKGNGNNTSNNRDGDKNNDKEIKKSEKR